MLEGGKRVAEEEEAVTDGGAQRGTDELDEAVDNAGRSRGFNPRFRLGD